MKKTLPILAIGVLAIPFVVVGQRKPSVGSLKKDLAEINRDKRNAQRKLSNTKEGIVDVKQQLGSLENRLQKLSNDLEDTADQLVTEQGMQKKLQEDFEKANVGVKEKKKQVEKRIGMIYRQGKPSILEFVFGSKSSADLSTREFVASRVVKADRRLFEEYRTIRAEAQEKKKAQDEVVQKISSLKQSQQSKQNELESTQKEKEGYLQNLQDKKVNLENVLDELDSDAAAIESEIKVAMARAKAEEKRRREEAKKRGETYVAPKHSGGLVRPTGGSITSSFGNRYHPILKYNRMHSGMDFGGGYGAAVYSAGSGTVIAASTRGGYGNCVIIDHGNGLTTVYGHLSKIMVRDGQTVSSHQRVGSIGSSGLSTGPHLHFEVRVNGKAVNPARYL